MADYQFKIECIYQFNINKDKIYAWKFYIIRTWVQDQIRHKTLNEIDKDSFYVHLDWAMKFKGQKAPRGTNLLVSKKVIFKELSANEFYSKIK